LGLALDSQTKSPYSEGHMLSANGKEQAGEIKTNAAHMAKRPENKQRPFMHNSIELIGTL
jgi:hypothetical protein